MFIFAAVECCIGFLQRVFDKFDCVFIDNGLDLQCKKLTCFLEREKFLKKFLITKIPCGKFLICGLLNSGPYCKKKCFIVSIFVFTF